MNKASTRPAGRFMVARLMLTTSVISLAPLVLLPTASFAQDKYLDNGNTNDSNYGAVDGTWTNTSAIWSDENGDNHDQLTENDTGVLRTNPNQSATITVSGLVHARKLHFTQGNLILEGGGLGSSRIGLAGQALTLETASNASAHLTGLSFGGAVDIRGAGTTHLSDVRYSSLHVFGKARLEGEQNAVAGIVNNGELRLNGAQVTGAVSNLDNNEGEGKLIVSANSTVSGKVTNESELVAVGNSDVTLSAAEFESTGGVGREGNGRLIISAGKLTLDEGHNLDNEDVVLQGAIVSSGVLNFTQDQILTGNLSNVQGDFDGDGDVDADDDEFTGDVNITAKVSANVAGMTVDNTQNFYVLGKGELSGVEIFNNTGTVYVATGSNLEAAQFNNLAGGEFDLAGELLGNLENAGRLEAKGEISGLLTNTNEVETTGNLTVGGVVNSDDVKIRENTTLTLKDGNFNNTGTLTVEGSIRKNGSERITNESGGTLNLDGNRINALIDNQVGATTELKSDMDVFGFFLNEGALEANFASDEDDVRTLNMQGFTFSNKGDIVVNRAPGSQGRLGIIADELWLQGSDVDTSDVKLTGKIINDAKLTFSVEEQLGFGLQNNGTGVIEVNANLGRSESNNILFTNSGELSVKAGVTLRGIDIKNHKTLTLRNSFDGNQLVRSSIRNANVENLAGGTFNHGGALYGSLHNYLNATTILRSGQVYGLTRNVGTISGFGYLRDGLLNTGQVYVENGTMEVTDLETSNTLTVRDSGTLLVRGNDVENAGTLTLVGDLTLDPTSGSGPDLINKGTGTIHLSGGDLGTNLTNEKDGRVVLNQSATIDGNFANAGDLSQQSANAVELDLNGHDFTNNGTISNVSGAGFKIIADELKLNAGSVDSANVTLVGKITNSAELLYSTASELQGKLTNQGTNGSVIVSSTLNANGYGIENRAKFQIGAGAGVTVGTLTNGVNGNLTVAGQLAGNLANNSWSTTSLTNGVITGNVTNFGGLNGYGTINGRLENHGQLQLKGLLSVGSLLSNSDLMITATDTLQVATEVENRKTLTLAGKLQIVSETGAITNLKDARIVLAGGSLIGKLINRDDGMVEITKNSSVDGDVLNEGQVRLNLAQTIVLSILNGHEFRNDGLISVASGGLLRIVADKIILDENSVLDASRVDLVGTVYNAGTINYTGPTVLDKDLNNAEGGVVRMTADVNGAGFNINNDGELYVLRDGNKLGNLHGVNAINNEGSFTIGSGAAAQAVTITNNDDGVITLAGSLTGAVSNTVDAQILMQGGTVNGNLANAGTVEGRGTVNGVLTNDGKLNVTGAMAVATLTNNDQMTVTGAGVLSSDNTIANAGIANVSGRIDGALNNSGTLNLQGGHLTGALDNSKIVNAHGSIDGAVTNNGTFNTTGALQLGEKLVNNNQLNINKGHAVTASGGIVNNKQLNLNGSVTGGVTNASGATAQLGNGSRVNGSVVNNGHLSGTANVTGTVRNNGTAQLSGNVGKLTNTGTLNVANGQQLSSAQTVMNSGALNLSGTLQVLDSRHQIVNQADGVITTDGANIIGNVLNQQGGRLDIKSNTSINGNLVSNGLIDMIGGGADTRLDINNGTFTNTGVVQVSGAGNLIIEADKIDLQEGSEVDNSRVTFVGSVSNSGLLTYTSDTTLNGDLDNAAGTVRVTANVDADGNDVTNNAIFNVGTPGGKPGRVTNVGTLTNTGNFLITKGSLVGAQQVLNRQDGVMNIAGTLRGSVTNDEGARIALADGRINGSVQNKGTLQGSGTITGTLDNSGTTKIELGQNLRVGQGVQNSGDFSINGAGATLTGSITNTGKLTGNGTVDGNVVNNSQLVWSGNVTGNLTNTSDARVQGRVDGTLGNTGTVRITGETATKNVLNEGRLTVANGSRLRSEDGIANNSDATLVNNGRIASDITNAGTYIQQGVLTGMLTTSGTARINGGVNGAVVYNGGELDLGDDHAINGRLVLNSNYAVNASDRVNATNTVVAKDRTLRLNGGQINGNLRNNDGIVRVAGTAGVSGALINNGLVDLTRGGDLAKVNARMAQDRAVGSTADRLNVGGLSGNGTYKLDVDLANMKADRITVQGGAATGRYHLQFNYSDGATVSEIGRSVLVLDIDETQGAKNDFRISADEISAASERIIYDVYQSDDNQDVYIRSDLNPAIGAFIGNVTLTQTLIGSVINRPTSPFVTNLAYEDKENPCGIGAWGRATGGTATTKGKSGNSGGRIESSISASYYGMQVGSDLACFDNRFNGWNMAFGVLAGVNQGDTNQPVYVANRNADNAAAKVLGSYNKTDFTQAYGGLYATATKGRFQADLQVRGERTDFTIENVPVASVNGLGLGKQDFSSTSTTLSGSVGYAFPVGDKGWSVVPTAGFSYTRIKTDSIRFDADAEGIEEWLDFEDSERTIGFIGGTVAKTFIQSESNSALYAFATGTVYHDFADPTVSIYRREGDDAILPQRMESDNLGTYGEISLGANYIKVLDEGGRGRQFSTSARIDTRFGEGLDSVGVSGQVRWQF